MNNKERRDLAIIQQNVRGRDIENDGLWSMQDYIEMAKEIKAGTTDDARVIQQAAGVMLAAPPSPWRDG